MRRGCIPGCIPGCIAGFSQVQIVGTGRTSHLLGATVQFLTEMLVIEVTAPQMHSVRQPDLYDVRSCGSDRFGPNAE